MVNEENEDVDVVYEHGSYQDGNVSLTHGRNDTFDMHMKVTCVGVVVQAASSVYVPKDAVGEFTSLIHWVVVLAQALNVTEEVLHSFAFNSIAFNVPLVAFTRLKL